MSFRRAWEGREWQAYAFQLIQRRHGPTNVQMVPDRVWGDAGLECFTTCGCLYQCFAPQETAAVKKAASAMKTKAARDLQKIYRYKSQISLILSGTQASRWILLCPFLDDKEVVAAIRKRGLFLKGQGVDFLASDFEALCHSQEDFAGEIAQLRALSQGPPLKVEAPSVRDIATAARASIGTKIDEKLGRAYGARATPELLTRRRNELIKAHLYRENALDQLRLNHSILWERAFLTLEAEEARLVAFGLEATVPAAMLQDSADRIQTSLLRALPTLPNGTVTQIAIGTVSDWLIRCPLDFLSSGLT